MSSRPILKQRHSDFKDESDSLNIFDFIGPSSTVKSLFSVPYATDKPINVAIHNISGTLLVDAIDEANDLDESLLNNPLRRKSRRRPRPVTFERNSLQHDETMAVVHSALGGSEPSTFTNTQELFLSDTKNTIDVKDNSTLETLQLSQQGMVTDLSKLLPPPEHYLNETLPHVSRNYVTWKFRDMQLLMESDTVIYSDTHAVRVADAQEWQSILQSHQESVKSGSFVADYQMARLQQRGKPTYLQALKTSHSPSSSVAPQSPPTSFSAPDLDCVKLQTCIVPSSTSPLGGLLSEQSQYYSRQPTAEVLTNSAPVCTVIDAYLDNIIANVPQLALCLREKGFIQSVKLLETKDIPSHLMQPSTLESTKNFSIQKVDTTSSGEPLFSPAIMEMNATTLLRFLKANCTRDNSTYLLRREAGHSEIQLYDVTSISASRQRKWIWWLATISYRFALRLGHLSSLESAGQRRSFRCRQRSLLENTLQLLEDLADMDGSVNETLCAAVSENLADTFLATAKDGEIDYKTTDNTLSSPPYAHVTIDALGKAQDHLRYGILKLYPLLERAKIRIIERKKRRNQNQKKIEVSNDESSSSDEEYDDDDDYEKESSLELQSVTLQLFSLHYKLINVSLRLAEHHLNNYWSSSAMQALKSTARAISDAIALLRLRNAEEDHLLQLSLRYQYTWLWEHCGHFARTFAADNLWRERGHTSGEDILCVLRDVEKSIVVDADDYNPNDWFNFAIGDAPITDNTGGLVSLNEVGSIVEKESATTISEIQNATKFLDQQKAIQREKRKVLVAASVSYSRAIGSFEEILRIENEGNPNKQSKSITNEEDSNQFVSLLRQRLGDTCNEIGKILLQELRNLMASTDNKFVAEVILHSAQFWFDEGLKAFESCGDLRNLALLRCNLCQCWKIRANSNFASNEKGIVGNIHSEDCLQVAANHLHRAHEALGQHDIDPNTWDMVSQELASTYLVLGVRRRQTALGAGTIPVLVDTLRLSPGQERGIVEPMEQALAIYEKSRNVHQAAATHYQLALFYSRVWTCQRDESKTREKLSAAFHHYAAAHEYFAKATAGNESTFVVICLDLSNLYSAVSGIECLSHAVSRCLDTSICFSPSAIDAAHTRGDASDWLQNMSTLASSVEDRIFKLLLNLVKEEKSLGLNNSVSLYRTALTAKMDIKRRDLKDTDLLGRLNASYDLLSALNDEHERKRSE